MKKRLYVVMRVAYEPSFTGCKPIKIFQTAAAAMDFVMTANQREQSDEWEIVAEGGYYDGINATKTRQEFVFENIFNEKSKEICYYIETLDLEEE